MYSQVNLRNTQSGCYNPKEKLILRDRTLDFIIMMNTTPFQGNTIIKDIAIRHLDILEIRILYKQEEEDMMAQNPSHLSSFPWLMAPRIPPHRGAKSLYNLAIFTPRLRT
jgi:hypothetical protein